MSLIKILARILGEPAPDILDDSAEGIAASARFVWFAVQHNIQRATASRTRRDGRPGFLWTGSVSGVISELWPEIEGGYLVAEAEVEKIKTAINTYHRTIGVMRCVVRPRSGIPPVWWVAEHWTGMTVTSKNVQQERNQEKEEIRMGNKSVELLACREDNCDYVVNYPQVRASHELSKHSLRVLSDGTKVRVSDEKLTNQEVRELILRVAQVAESPESTYYFIRKARELDLRVTNNAVRRVLTAMVDDPQDDLIEFGSTEHYTRYFLASRAKGQCEELVSTLIGVPEPSNAPGKDSSFSEHIVNMKKLLADLETINDLETELNVDLQGKLQIKDEEIQQLRRDLAKITKERDGLKNTLSVIRNQLLGERN